jgi:hypothetical protein
MPQPDDLSRSLVALDQNSTIIAVVELSQSSWLVGGVLPGTSGPIRKQRLKRHRRQVFTDSPVEEGRFELSVPIEKV